MFQKDSNCTNFETWSWRNNCFLKKSANFLFFPLHLSKTEERNAQFRHPLLWWNHTLWLKHTFPSMTDVKHTHSVTQLCLQAENCTQLNWYANRQTSEQCRIHPNNARGMTDINKRAEVFVCSKLPDACASNTSCYSLKIRKNVQIQSKSSIQVSVMAVQFIKRSLT